MMNNFFNLIQAYNQLRKNPMQILTKRFNIPNTVDMNNPNEIIQHLLNTNQVSQSQINGFASNPQMQQIVSQLQNKQ